MSYLVKIDIRSSYKAIILGVMSLFWLMPGVCYGQSGLCYVLKQVVNLRQGPGQNYAIVAKEGRNNSLYCSEIKNGWARVANVKGAQGWVRNDLLSQLVIRIHKSERLLVVEQGGQEVLSLKVTPGHKGLGDGRYFGRWVKDRLVLDWPSRKDRRAFLAKGQMTYGEYVKALRSTPEEESLLALCGVVQQDDTCGVLLSAENMTKLHKRVPHGARVEIYADRDDDLALNDMDDLSRRIFQGALKQLQSPAAGLGPENRPPRLFYPGGDIQPDFATSADIVIRAVRSAGLDLQATVHEDMLLHPKRYKGLESAGSGAHRSVPVLYTYFQHHALTLPLDVREDPFGFEAGDIVFFASDVSASPETQKGKVNPQPSAQSSVLPDHVGVVSETFNAVGYPLVISVWDMGHTTRKMDLLGRSNQKVVGHFRMTHLFDYQ